MEDALAYVASVLNESGTLDIVVGSSRTSGNGFLISGGTYFTILPGFSNGTAFRRLHNKEGKVFENGVEEIFIRANFGYELNVDVVPEGDSGFDLQSLLLFSITHGLGFLSLSDSRGYSRIYGSYKYSGLDAGMKNGADELVFFGWPPFIEVDRSSFTSNDIYFRGPRASAVYGSAPPLYSPSPFVYGSSLSHWRQGYVGNAVMQPFVPDPGDISRRTYSALDIAALEDIGWSMSSGGDLRVISGHVLSSVNEGIPGVRMQGWPGIEPVTDSSGYYEGTVNEGWSGTITPSKDGHVFQPSSRTYSNVTANQTAQNHKNRASGSALTMKPWMIYMAAAALLTLGLFLLSRNNRASNE